MNSRYLPTISVPLDSALVGDLFCRMGAQADVPGKIESIVREYLLETADSDQWSESYRQRSESLDTAPDLKPDFGDPHQGVHWAPLFLPNGTLVRMDYKRKTFHAAIKGGHLVYKGKAHSPSEFACAVANGTNRNAWRDLLIKRPSDSSWTLAEELRVTRK
jgi:hypothetical protein